ncbi:MULTISPECIES: stage II sporulation protein M [Brevibacterium]|uniref:Stage II sporulation protein M n=1 Tax=Brevibacterium casei TaxID=33889 RepID=A0A7T3ZWY7_9MICO|nr:MULTISPECIES: stage II sporulation protein M [Brevibacterium]QQB13165.1 stage II sporulation protein M [Brevibacterium casei]
MDPNLLAEMHGEKWRELADLAKRNRLDPAQAQRFLDLYRAASKDLSQIMTVAPDSLEAARLSAIVHRARNHLSSVPAGGLSGIARYFAIALPLSIYRLRWDFVVIALAFLAASVLAGVWAGTHPEVLDTFGDYEYRRQFAEQDFVEYYKENPNGFFAIGVWTNNAWIAVQFVLLGVTGVFVLQGLFLNAVNVGFSGAMMFEFDRGADFFLYILPHGIPEISCILLAAAAGLRLFFAWVIPGPQLRRTKLAREARSLLVVAGGLVIMLFLSGLIEGFVTPNPLPPALKIAIGVAYTAAIVVYAGTLGRRAARAGLSADLEDHEAGYAIVATDR